MRTLVKRLAERTICSIGATTFSRFLNRHHTLVLCYHNIVPDGESAAGDISLHLPQSAFSRQLDELRRTHEIVSLTSLVDEHRGSGRPRAVITFDDACRGAITAGVHELSRRDLPGTFFVVPGRVGTGPFWWDMLREADSSALSWSHRDHALHKLAGQSDRILEWAGTAGLRVVRDVHRHQAPASESEIEAAMAAGMTIASHTWTHPNLAALDPAALDSELELSAEWIRARGGIPWIAYPYGLTSPAVEAAAARAGYVHGLLVEGGYIRADAFSLPRQNVGSGLSMAGFRIRAAGLAAG